jgi:hypothetical protein
LVRLDPASAEKLKGRLDALSEAHGYDGPVLIRTDEKLRAGEVSIDWSDGVVSIDPNDIAQRVEALMDAALAASEHH